MACIGCGLGINADGDGRVDIDLEGGLQCTGDAGGTTNTAGRGVGIKIDPAAGNQASVGPDGLLVTAANAFEIITDSIIGASATGSNENVWSSPQMSIPIHNDTAFTKVYTVNPNMRWDHPGDVTVIAQLILRTTGAWFVAAETIQAAGAWAKPVGVGQYVMSVAPGAHYDVQAQMFVRGPAEVTIPQWGFGVTLVGGIGTLTHLGD